MPKKSPGLTKRQNYWHINKTIRGHRLYESTGTGDLEEAERYLSRRIQEVREEIIHGEKRERTFIQAATKYLNEETKKSLARDAVTLKAVMPYIADLSLEKVHMGTLAEFISDRQRNGISSGTINRDLAVIRRILVLAARLWRDDNGRTWLSEVPLLQMIKGKSRKPYPISWEQQSDLLAELPPHLAKMVLFAVNTGCREREITGLMWCDEIPGTSTFVIQGERAKNGEERIICLNSISNNIIDSQRGVHDQFVFTYKGRPVQRINGSAWRKARERARLTNCRVHDLRHTFGRRLRSVDVSFEDRQDLLGHKSGRITTHYSKAEITNLLIAVEKLCQEDKMDAHLRRIRLSG